MGSRVGGDIGSKESTNNELARLDFLVGQVDVLLLHLRVITLALERGEGVSRVHLGHVLPICIVLHILIVLIKLCHLYHFRVV